MSTLGLWGDLLLHLPSSSRPGYDFRSIWKASPYLSTIWQLPATGFKVPRIQQEVEKFPRNQNSWSRRRDLSQTLRGTFWAIILTIGNCNGGWELPPPTQEGLEASSQALGAAPSPEDTGRAEEVPREGGQSLQAETRAWFQKTQAQGLLQHGAAPPWFHGFITRREAERLLETKPEGCYLVRFSESAVTFVLTYKSRTCCRHFLLAQLADGRHVVLGEDSAHTRLQDLLRYYTGSPLSPYGETLSQPLARKAPEPAGLSLRTEESDSGSKSQDVHPQYSPVLKKENPKVPTQKEGNFEPKEPPRPKPPVPAKPQLPTEVYTSSTLRPRRALPRKPSNPIYHEPDEPIAFYAMGRGSPGEAPSNIYAEVEVAVPSKSKSPPCILQHPVLCKCPSRPVPQSQNPGGQQPRSENSAAEQGSLVPHQPLPLWRHSLPHTLSRQVLQDRGRAWLSLGPPQ